MRGGFDRNVACLPACALSLFVKPSVTWPATRNSAESSLIVDRPLPLAPLLASVPCPRCLSPSVMRLRAALFSLCLVCHCVLATGSTGFRPGTNGDANHDRRLASREGSMLETRSPSLRVVRHGTLLGRQDCQACASDSDTTSYCCEGSQCYKDSTDQWNCGTVTTTSVTQIVTSQLIKTTTSTLTPQPSVVLTTAYTTRTSWTTVSDASAGAQTTDATTTANAIIRRDADSTATQTVTSTSWLPERTVTITAHPSSGVSAPVTTSTSLVEIIVVMPTMLPTPTSPPSQSGSHKAPVGAIVGGIVAGVLALALVFIIAVLFLRRRRKQAAGNRLSDGGDVGGSGKEISILLSTEEQGRSNQRDLRQPPSIDEVLVFPRPPSASASHPSQKSEPPPISDDRDGYPRPASEASTSSMSMISPVHSSPQSAYPASPVSPMESPFTFGALRNDPYSHKGSGDPRLPTVFENNFPAQPQYRVPRKPVPTRNSET